MGCRSHHCYILDCFRFFACVIFEYSSVSVTDSDYRVSCVHGVLHYRYVRLRIILLFTVFYTGVENLMVASDLLGICFYRFLLPGKSVRVEES